MTIIKHKVEVALSPSSKNHFLALGYPFQQVKPRTLVTVNSTDLMAGSSVVVRYRCDRCRKVHETVYFSLVGKKKHLCRSCTQQGKKPSNTIVFTDQQKHLIRRLYKEDRQESDQIAEILDVSGPTVRKYLKEVGLFQGRRSKPPNCECPVCGAIFRKSPTELHEVNCCSKACRGVFITQWAQRECEECGQAFKTKPHQTYLRFCSTECWYKHNTLGSWTTCETCGKRIWSTPSRPRSFCSRECSGEANKTGESIPCCYCGRPVYRPKCHLRTEQYFCSAVCYYAFRDSDDEYRKSLNEKIRDGIVDRWETDVEWATQQRERLSQQALDTIETWQKKGSRLEFIIHSMLDDLGIAYEKWRRVRPADGGAIKEFDVYFPGTDSYLEIHGGFWHADPRPSVPTWVRHRPPREILSRA